MKRIAVLTTGRQDWGLLRRTCALLDRDARFELLLFVGGMHCSRAHGLTESLVADDGFTPAARLTWIVDGDTAASEAGRATAFVGEALARHLPDALVVLGDRFETVSAALAATLARVPIVHLHGGEQTLGAIDDALRHAITKLSHLHLVSNRESAARVAALAEDPATIRIVGAPGLDNLFRDDLLDRAALEQMLQLELEPPLILVTVHPTTLARSADAVARSVCEAMDLIDATYVVSLPNSDPGSEAIREVMSQAARRPRRVAVRGLGDRAYWSLMRLADAMVGNSSSGVIEAPPARVPAVNVGERQAGRRRSAGVIDVGDDDAASVATAMRQALEPGFRASLGSVDDPLVDGHVADRIVEALADWSPPSPPRKAPILVGGPRE